MEEFYNELELLTSNIEDINLKSHLIQYKRSIKSIIDYFNDGNDVLKDRIINDNIFTEIVFDKILSNINNNNYEKANFLLGKEVLRIRMMLHFISKGIYTHDVITQEVALDTLVEYQKQYLKKSGIKVGKKYNYKDLNLSDSDISKIACMVIHPALIDIQNYRHL